ncbi:PREDICTED: 60S ribosomal protein L39-like [Elephantulus edwardii]|uniref:60S ribosomal protein L39-like n=1 Tax=Elephantulus edwardii TaxID=28737 RepID=UPI0003F08508|nr:PREDICTED: 60S ribosomal protein L39-like [Elephantulus edwardii]
MSSHKTFRIKGFLVKKNQKQNSPIPQWSQTKTVNKTRYLSKRSHRRTNFDCSIKTVDDLFHSHPWPCSP